MKKLLLLTLILTLGLSGAALAGTQFATILRDTTVEGQPGFIYRDVFEEPGYTEIGEFLAFIEEGMYRIYAVWDFEGEEWFIPPGEFYYVPVSSMSIGQEWFSLPTDDLALTVATVSSLDTISVPAGTFPGAYRVDIRRVVDDPESPPLESLWFVQGVGRVYSEAYVYGSYTVDYYQELVSYEVSGSGFLPSETGNSWTWDEIIPIPSPVEEEIVPRALHLSGAVPNPFNPSTTISFDIQKPGHVSIRVFDLTGRLVATLVDGHREVGHHAVSWNGRNDEGRMSPAGVYLYRLEQGRRVLTRQMTLVK